MSSIGKVNKEIEKILIETVELYAKVSRLMKQETRTETEQKELECMAHNVEICKEQVTILRRIILEKNLSENAMKE